MLSETFRERGGAASHRDEDKHTALSDNLEPSMDKGFRDRVGSYSPESMSVPPYVMKKQMSKYFGHTCGAVNPVTHASHVAAAPQVADTC